MLSEEWGLVIALLAVACILTLAWFAVRASRAGRSSFYTIACLLYTSNAAEYEKFRPDKL